MIGPIDRILTRIELDALASIDPDDLIPKQALEALYRLKGRTAS